MKKTLALLLALVMVFALCACAGGNEEPAAAAPAEAPAAAPAEAPAAPAEAPAAPAAAGDDFAEWKAYLKEYVSAGAPNEELGKSLMAEVDAATTAEEMENIMGLAVMFSDVGVLRFADWVAAGKPAADTSNMGTPPSTGEPSGEAS